MSQVAEAGAEFDFWEFVCCDRCQRPFFSESLTAVPFWLTNCGHVVCNSHLNPNQSCMHCGTNDIQVIPLQREMDSPMSSWFRSVSGALDEVAFAMKIQQENMGGQIRKLRHRDHQLRTIVERLRRDVSELQKLNQQFSNENNELRRRLGMELRPLPENLQSPSDIVNSNGKRPIAPAPQYDLERRPTTNSSPRSVPTPLGPNRLTIPPDQQVSELSSSNQHLDGAGNPYSTQRFGADRMYNFSGDQRLTSNRLAQEYSYRPPETPQYHAPPLTHTQAAPRIFQRTQQAQRDQQQPQHVFPRPDGQQSMTPGTSSKFKPALGPAEAGPSNRQSAPIPSDQSQNRGPLNQQDKRKTNMGPPPTPQHARQNQNGSFAIPGTSTSVQRTNTLAGAQDTHASVGHFKPLTPLPQRTATFNSAGPQRFLPNAASHSTASQKLMPSSGTVSRAPSRMSAPTGGSHRMSFAMPGTRDGGLG